MTTSKFALITCPYCEARVQAKVLAEREYPPTDDYDPFKYSFVECISCHNVLVGYSEWGMIGPQDDGWNEPVRQWPDPDKQPHSNIPLSIQRSLEEAKKCFSTKSYRACAVMCGKAVEEICKDKDEKIENLGEGLKLLKEARIIDEKLFEWGEVLRAERNIGAHARDETISDQDASDMLDFATAISEYIYVLDGKYKAYKERKAKKAT